MVVSHVFCISVLLLLGQMLYRAVTQQCTGGGSEKSLLGWMLQGHIYKTMFAELPHTCVLTCRKDDRCQSFNWVISISMCEFSNRTKEARPEDYIPNPDRFYFGREMNKVSLGSIPELPAETCKEIKASEGGQAVSGKYWFYTIKPGVPVQAYCNMKTLDVDECTASSPVCDVNANCTNTRGSYFCTCKSGFSGDGKTCTDVDECTASSPVCDINAICANTRGSYFCTCKSGFSGDGKTCTVSECSNYQNLTSSNRKVTQGSSPGLCDNSLGPGWFRFQGNAGTKMPTSCVSPYRCGTDSTGWLNGAHPTVQEGKVTRQVCFSWSSNCCNWSINIQVLNCGPYFLYFISGTPPEHSCHLRYCGTD